MFCVISAVSTMAECGVHVDVLCSMLTLLFNALIGGIFSVFL